MATPGLRIGDTLPNFELFDQHGKLFRLSDTIGKCKLVLFFYPKDFTPGCIKEVCAFRDRYETFIENGVAVIGVSSDSINSHQKFSKKFRLPFRILADPKGETRKLFGVSNSFFGLLPARETFVIDEKGVILHRFNNQFGAEKHIEESLKVLRINS